MLNRSHLIQGPEVEFPEFEGERVYMQPFTLAHGLPDDLARWQKTVNQMLSCIDVPLNQTMYLMIDQQEVKQGELHRRGGKHIDGYWIPGISAHGTPGPGSTHNTPTHNIPSEPGRHNSSFPRQTHHTPYEPDFGMSMHTIPGSDLMYAEWQPEALILASDVKACRAWRGFYEGLPEIGGDCEHIDVSALEEIWLEPNITYAGNVMMIHESMPVSFDCKRTLVRINIPGWSPA